MEAFKVCGKKSCHITSSGETFRSIECYKKHRILSIIEGEASITQTSLADQEMV